MNAQNRSLQNFHLAKEIVSGTDEVFLLPSPTHISLTILSLNQNSFP